MKNIFIFILISSIIFTISCKNEIQQKNVPHLSIELNDDPILLSEITNSISFIPIRGFKPLSSPIMTDFFIYDTIIGYIDGGDNSINVFSTNGKAICQFRKLGKGPDEYEIPSQIFYDYENQLIYIYSINNGTAIGFDFNAKKIKSFRPHVIVSDIAYQKGNFVFYNNNEITEKYEPGIFSYNLKSKKTKQLKRFGAINTMAENNYNRFYYVNTQLNIYSNLFDTIYTIEDLNFTPKTSFDFRKNTLPTSLRSGIQPINVFNDKVIFYQSIMESDKYIFMNLLMDRQPYIAIKHQDSSIFITGKNINNDINGIIPSIGYPHFIRDNTLNFIAFANGTSTVSENVLKIFEPNKIKRDIILEKQARQEETLSELREKYNCDVFIMKISLD